MDYIDTKDSRLSSFLFKNKNSALIWFVVRIYVGWQWLVAGWGKINSDVWVGSEAGKALSGFVQGSLVKSQGSHPDVQGWYAYFLEHLVAPNADIWSYFVVYGEVVVGIALIIGAFVGVAAFFGFFMNLNYLLAGTVSTNPVLLVLSIGLVLAWRVAGYMGLDRFIFNRFTARASDPTKS